MLLFISCGLTDGKQLEIVSIHLMLLFISKSDVKEVNLNRFQYISCYSLSLRPQENIPCQTRFNTSHVTLYPEVHPVSDPSSTFQYISCYSLSLCWCAVLRITFGFNTSHVTLYRYYANLIRQMKRVSIHLMLLFINVDTSLRQPSMGFNTSHVTLYRRNERHD